ncbi:hypothetical protein HM1_1284 [Heliomicrobium modesticaldum Ice1]|uniref:Uncharacterized protein n=1 Tax=Heliobacterium modesticaldum (strain ATCC 51547 / Ice1) TaxID=498761 RepID=B0TGN2_HELMI|nr:hypothetical protein HM1_1284 [Heliomicrobium modesticaldum Ice1]
MGRDGAIAYWPQDHVALPPLVGNFWILYSMPIFTFAIPLLTGYQQSAAVKGALFRRSKK